MRKRSKSIHTSVPFSLEGEEKPNESSDEEGEVPKLDQSNSGSGADDNGSDGKENKKWNFSIASF